MTARIYQPAQNAMQSGKARDDIWVLKFDAQSRRTADPLMGWTSSSDTCQQVKMRFASKQAAIDYATREGLAYVVQKQHKIRRPAKSYSDNFKFGRHANWTH